MRDSLWVVPLALAALAVAGCARDFWDRGPRVAARTETAAALSPGAYAGAATPAPAPYPRVPAPAVPEYAAPAPSVPAPYASAAAPDDRAPSVEESEVLARVNRIREGRGLRPFGFDASLYRAAQDHSDEQNRYGYMGHGSPDPARNTLLQRVHAAGCTGSVFGEVVAWGYESPQAVVEGWMNSRDHRAILVDPDLTHGAFARAGATWTGDFGSPLSIPAPRPWPAPPAVPAPSPRPAPTRPAPIVRDVPPGYAAPSAPRPSYVVPAAPAYRAPAAPAPASPGASVYFRPAPSPAPAPAARPAPRGG